MNTLPETNIFAPEDNPLEVRRFLLETIIFRGELLVLGSVHAKLDFGCFRNRIRQPFFRAVVSTIGLPSLKLTAKAPENRQSPKRKQSSEPTLHFQVLLLLVSGSVYTLHCEALRGYSYLLVVASAHIPSMSEMVTSQALIESQHE